MRTSVPRLMPSSSECRVPYLLSNLLLVTESLTLIAGNVSSPAAESWYRRRTPVVVSPVTPLTDSATVVHFFESAASERRSSSRKTLYSAESCSSSIGGTTPAFSNWAPLSTSIVASPPSSRIMLAGSPGQVSICSAAHQYSSRVSPFQAKTGTPLGSSGVPCGPTTTAAAAWSWVEKMLHDAQRTCA